MYRTIELNSSYPASGKLVLLLTDIRNFDVILRNIYSTVHNGGTDHGKVTVSFVTSDGTTFQTQDFNITGTAQDFDMHYLYTTTLPLAGKVEMVFSAVNDNDDCTKIYWDGGIELYKERFVISPTPNELYFTGWVQPDQLSRRFMTDQYFISMNATDSLADLKQVQFPFDYSMTTGLTSVVQVLKKSLEPVGLPLPFKGQLNISEAHLSTGQTVLKNIYVNPQKFLTFKNGKQTFENSYDAIGGLLGAFNARLFQSSGHYHIVQNNEVNSKQQTINWNNLSATTINYNRAYSGVTKVLAGTDELSKVRPLKRIEYTFNDLNTGYYYPFPSNFDLGASVYTALSSTGGTFQFSSNFLLGSGGGGVAIENEPAYINGASFGSEAESGTTVTLRFDVDLDQVIFNSTGGQLPLLKVELMAMDSAGDKILDSVNVEFISGSTKTVFVNLKYAKNQDTGVFYHRLWVVPRGSVLMKSYNVYFSKFKIFLNNDSDQTEHVLFTGELNNNAIDLFEDEIDFGTSDSILDSGALMYAPSALTTTWSNYGFSDAMKLQNLLIKNKLTENSRFKNYLRVTVKTDSIRFNQLIAILGKLYQITAYSFDLLNNNLQLELVEYLNSPVTITYTEEKLKGKDES